MLDNKIRVALGAAHFFQAAALIVGVISAPVRSDTPLTLEPTPPPISGRSLSEPDSILAADVLARLELVRANVELIRRFMGIPAAPEAVLHVADARPRETFSQALNLERRANKLAFEQARVARESTPPEDKNIRPYDVLLVTNRVLQAVLQVKRELGVQTSVSEKLQPEDTTPTDVFNATVLAGGEINNMLAQRTSASDVFEIVTSAVHIAASLHVSLPDGPSFPEEPPFEPNKSPLDVFLRLQRCFTLISELAARQGIDLLQFDFPPERALGVQPNDVSDMAYLVLEELNGIYRRTEGAPRPSRAFYPGRRFAAHVYQRVGLLERVLQDLVEAQGATAAASR